jgi:DNA repair protein RadC
VERIDRDGDVPRTMIRDLPPAERPRERLRDAGAGSLSTSELLAIVLRVGGSKESALAQANRIVARFNGLAGLARAPFRELCEVHGIGPAKAAQLKAALELGLRAAKLTPGDRPTVRDPDDVAALLAGEMSLLEQEHVRVVLLDARNRVLAIPEVYHGSVHTAQVRIGELFRDAVRANASAVVAVHNHPSGDAAPSQADTAMTKQLVEAGVLLDIDVFDHLIIAGGRYASMRQLGLGFAKAAAP